MSVLIRAFFLLIFWSVFVLPTMADEAAVAPVYPITEPDMLTEIHARLAALQKSGELAKLQQEAIERSKKHIEEPVPAPGFVTTAHPKTWYFDPSWRAQSETRTPDGKVIVHAGQVVNPLDYVSLNQNLIFFDGRDPDQIKQAAALITLYQGRAKPIMVAGEPLKLTRIWKRQVYFDQGGALLRRFGITQVPAVVSQVGKRLRIDEMSPQEKP